MVKSAASKEIHNKDVTSIESDVDFEIDILLVQGNLFNEDFLLKNEEGTGKREFSLMAIFPIYIFCI